VHGWQVIPARTEASPLVSAALVEKRKCGTKVSQKTGARRAQRSTSARGHRRKSMKVVANLTLLDVEVGASDKLPLTIRQSFKDG
jgi:hypothetical protein